MIGRREFITLLGGAAAAWPLAARAQRPVMPVIGYLSSRTSNSEMPLLDAFRQGLGGAGYAESRNVAIEYRFADGQYDRLPALAADLVRRRVTVIVAVGGIQSALAAKAATATIPIVFAIGSDPTESGLAVSLSRPGGNLTGATNLNTGVAPKLLEILHELVPAATSFALLVNPTNPSSDTESRDLQRAARALGLALHILHASSELELDTAFTTLSEAQAGALVIVLDPFFTSRSEQLAALTLRHAVPTAYQHREFVVSGGLMSYGGSRTDEYLLAGGYAGRILKGDKPADLPVQQSTKVELIINLKTAKALGLTVPPALLARADEVIE